MDTREPDDLLRRPGDFERLEELRRAYLEVDAKPWADARDLWLYHRTFGERIRWKWEAVLAEQPVARLAPLAGDVVDFGCGSGVASLALLSSGLVESGAAFHLVDASPLARRFAAERLVERGAVVAAGPGAPTGAIGTLLASHVLTEIEPADEDRLVELATRARRVIVVEPGTRAVARSLVALRERLRGEAGLAPVAPCPHQGACGLAARASAPNEAWCHHFAAPPQQVFTSRSWREFGERLGIDLRSLPLSFLVLERDAALDAAPTGLETVRILGRPRWEKGRARFEVCHAGGVHSADLLARTNRAVHRALREPEAVPQRYHARLAPQGGDALRLEVCEPIAAPTPPT